MRNNTTVYNEYLVKFASLITKYDTAKTEDDELAILRVISETADELSDDSRFEANDIEAKIVKEQLISFKEQEDIFNS